MDDRVIQRALVLDGGGLRGAFIAGVLETFYRSGIDYRFFDCYLGSSAGAYSIAYFLTGQIEEGLRIWRKHLHPHLFGWRMGRPYIDLQHLVWVLREGDPLDVRLLRERNVPAFAVLSDIGTGRPHYENISEAPDPVTVLEAAVAMPFLTKPVTLHGRRYCDGGMTDAIPLRKAEKLGAEKIWVITPLPTGFRRNPLLWKRVFRFASFDEHLRELFMRRPDLENPIRAEIEARLDLIVVRPEDHLPVSWMQGNRESIEASIELGKAAALNALKTQKLI